MLAELQREFGGSADATATAAGRLEIFKNRINDVKERLGTFAIKAVTDAFDRIGGAVHYVQSVLKTVDLTAFHDAWASVGSVVRDLGQTFGSLKSSLDPVKGDFDPLAETIQKLAKGGLNILTDMLWKVYEGLSAVNGLFHGGKGPLEDYANGLKQWEPPLKNIASLLMGQFQDSLKFVGQQAQQIGGWFKSSLLPALKDAAPGFSSLAHTILDTVVPALIQIRGMIIEVAEHAFAKWLPIVEKIVPILVRFGGILAKDISDALKFIVPHVMEAEKAVAKFADQVSDRVAPIVKKWLDGMMPKLQAFADWWQANWPTILAVLENVWTQISGVVKIAWSLVSGIILIGLDILSGNWKQAWEDVKGMLAGVWDGMMTYLRGVWGNIQLIFAPIGQWFHDRWQSVVDGFHSVLSGLGGIASNIWGNVTGAVKSGFNSVIDLVNGVISHINSINIGGVGVHIDMIPHLARGTDFFGGGLAVMGEDGPELAYLPRGARIIPAAQTAQMLSSAGGSKQPVTIIFQVGSQRIAQAFLPDLISQVRHMTGNWSI
jgi:phage-related protein